MADVHWSHQRNELVGRTADRKLTAFWRNSSDKQRRKWHPHSSTFAWKIPRIEEPGRLQSMGRKEPVTTERIHFHFHTLEKEMATHPNVLAWTIPGMGKPGGLQSMGSHRVGHD